MKIFLRRLLTFVIISIVLLILLSVLGVFDRNIKTYTAVNGKFEHTMEKKGYVFFHEYILASPFDAKIKYLVKDGMKVPGKTKVAIISSENIKRERPQGYIAPIINKEIINKRVKALEDEAIYYNKNQKQLEREAVNKELQYSYLVQKSLKTGLKNNEGIYNYVYKDGKIEIYTKEAGVVSLYSSSVDKVLSLNNIYILDYDKLEVINRLDEKVKSEALKGEPIMRIIENREFFVVTKVKKEELHYFETPGRISVEIEGNSIEPSVYKIFRSEKDYFVILKVMQEFKNYQNLKFINLTLVPTVTEGIAIKKSSVVQQNNKPGVYVLLSNGQRVFRRIKVIDKHQDSFIVETGSFYEINSKGEKESVVTVKTYDEIIEEPKNAKKD